MTDLTTIAGILRRGKPVDAGLRDGWLYSVFTIARYFLITDPCFNALGFVYSCGVTADEEDKWYAEFDERSGRRWSAHELLNRQTV